MRHGVFGAIAEAVANLTMFQKESFDDAIAMNAKRSETEQELRDRNISILEQEAALRNLR